jgi:hypothetical protein
VAPVVEESLKGIAILLVMLIFSQRFNSLMDGLVYAGITALGFAATENIYYIYNYGYLESGIRGLLYLVFVRVLLVGWQHPFFTAFTGIGVAMARLTRNFAVRLAAPILGWASAVMVHSVHNTLANFFTSLQWSVMGTILDWAGWLVMFGFIIWAIHREQVMVKQMLADELAGGILTPGQYRVATSVFGQSIARMAALSTGRYAATDRFYQFCGVLAHTKQVVKIFGGTDQDLGRIHALRIEILALGTQVVSGDEPLPSGA